MARKFSLPDILWTLLGFLVAPSLMLLVILIGVNSADQPLLLPAVTRPAPLPPPFTPTAASVLSVQATPDEIVLPTTASPVSTASPDIVISPTPLASSLFTSLGVVDQEAAARLYEVSLTYLASTEQEANRLARKLAFAGPASHASNMCGPLAIALLRDAGLLDVYVDLHDFWLLPMDKNPAVVEEVFPPAEFEHYHFDVPINEFDFSAFPLFPGDFLYLYSGSRGTFSHMLTVTRVDASGRAYTVTNVNGPDGYTVKEAMLYDPSKPGEGLFYEYTDRAKNRLYGLTGYGGFDVIRRKAPLVVPSAAQQAFVAQVNALIDQTGGDWRVLVHEIGGRDVYSRHADRVGPIASMIRLPVALLFFKSLENSGVPPQDFETYIRQYGSDGRTYEQLLSAMLVYAEEEALQSLLRAIEYNGLRANKVLLDWGLESTSLNARRSTPREIARLYEMLYTDAVLPPEANRLLQKYLAEAAIGRDTRLAALSSLMTAGTPFLYQGGSVIRDALIVGDSALVVVEEDGQQRAFVLVLLAYDSPLAPTTYEKLESAFAEFAGLFWRYVRAAAP